MSKPFKLVVTDALSLLTTDVLNRAATFLIYALVARALGAQEFGQLSLALTLFFMFQVLAVAGLKSLVTREISRDLSETGVYVVHASIVATIASVASYLALLVFLRVMDYSAETTTLVAILCLALLPYSLSSVFEAAFQAWQRMYFVACAHLATTIARVGLVVFTLMNGGGVIEVAVLMAVTHLLVMLIEGFLLLRTIGVPATRISPGFVMRLGRATVTFLGIEGVLTVAASLNVLILSKLVGETEVGLYSAAMQLLVPAGLVFKALAASVYPVMCRDFQAAPARLVRVTRDLLELLLIIAVPMLVIVLALAEDALRLVYGREEFVGAATLLRVMTITVVPLAVTNTLGQVLFATARERVTLRIAVIDSAAAVLGGFGLIALFGLTGAAVAAVLTRTVDLIQHWIAVASMFSRRAMLGLIWKPLLAGLVVAAYLHAVAGQNFIAVLVSACLIYGAVVLGLMAWSLGGFQKIAAHYLGQSPSRDDYGQPALQR